jgi:hypothetical protein
MISYRLPWFTLLGGPMLMLTAYALPLPHSLEQSLMLAGVLLLLDGGLGLRTLPPLTPHASYPDDWRQIEHRLYAGKLGGARFGVAALACITLGLASASRVAGDCELWFMVVTILAWAVGWFAASLKAIRDTLANDT